MGLDSSADWFDKASGILGQLLKYTEQLAGCENDPNVDVQALSEACDRRLAELKKILSKSARAPSQHSAQTGEVNVKLVGMIRELHQQIQRCKEILEKKRARVAGELDGLSKTKRAIRAYKN